VKRNTENEDHAKSNSSKKNIHIIPATLLDYPTLQNLARFYLYDMTRYCGFISEDWACPENGLYECNDFKKYFEEASRKAYLIRVKKELAGFVLLNKRGTSPETDWNMGEFFVLSKFQGKGVSYYVAHQIWQEHKGQWEIAVIPENIKALTFWRKAISDFTGKNYTEEVKTIDYDEDQPKRHVLSFRVDSKS